MARCWCVRRLAAGIAVLSVSTAALLSPAWSQTNSPAMNKAKEAAAALTRGDAALAITAYSEALSDTTLPNDRRAVILNDRGVGQTKLGQIKAAIDDFNQAVQLFPEYAAVYNNRGNVLLNLGLTAEAIKDFDRAILLAPGYAAAYNNRGSAYLKAGQTAEAVRDFTSAIKLMPSSAVPLSGRGQVYLSINRPHAAIRDFTRAVNSDARFAAAYRNRGEAKIAVGQHEGAIEDLSRAIAFDINNASCYVLRGEAYLAANNIEASIQDFSRAIELEPGNAGGYEARGLAHTLSERYEDAFGDLNRAVEINPRSAVAFAYRAFAYRQTGQLDVGARDIQTAWKIEPDRAEVLWAKGELEEGAGRRDEAIADLRKALDKAPSFKPIVLALERLGVSLDDGQDKVEPELGLEPWQVVSKGGQFWAVNDAFPRLRVPLETLGEGRPKLIEWEEKTDNLKGIGVLRFQGGTLTGRKGAEAVELSAIIDLYAKTVVAIQPHRLGDKVATWTWNDTKVVVASADGVTDEHVLRAARRDPGPRRYTASEGQDVWAPWGQTWGPQGGYGQKPRRARRKPKTIFDLLFNN